MDHPDSLHYLEPVHASFDWGLALSETMPPEWTVGSTEVIKFHWAVEEGVAYGIVAGEQEDILIRANVHAIHRFQNSEDEWGDFGKLILRLPSAATFNHWERSTSDYLHRCRDGTLIVSRRRVVSDGLGGADVWVLRGEELVLEHHFKPEKQRHNMHDMSSYYLDTCFSLSPDERYLYAFSGIYLAVIDLEELTVKEKVIDDRTSAVDGIHAVGEQVVVQRYSWDFSHRTPSLYTIKKPALPDGTPILTFSYVPNEYLPYDIGNLGTFAYRVFRGGNWEIEAVEGISYQKPINYMGYVSDRAEDFQWAQIQLGERFLIAYRLPKLDGHMDLMQVMNDTHTQVYGTWSFDELHVVEFPSLRRAVLDLRCMTLDGPDTDYDHLRYQFRDDGKVLYLHADWNVYGWEFNLE